MAKITKVTITLELSKSKFMDMLGQFAVEVGRENILNRNISPVHVSVPLDIGHKDPKFKSPKTSKARKPKKATPKKIKRHSIVKKVWTTFNNFYNRAKRLYNQLMGRGIKGKTKPIQGKIKQTRTKPDPPDRKKESPLVATGNLVRSLTYTVDNNALYLGSPFDYVTKQFKGEYQEFSEAQLREWYNKYGWVINKGIEGFKPEARPWWTQEEIMEIGRNMIPYLFKAKVKI